MDNFSRWRLYTDGLTSPDSYVNWGWYFLIGASLQRLVWMGGDDPEDMAVFPNHFIIFVGPPGVGKGLVMKKVLFMLKYHKAIDPRQAPALAKPISPEEQLLRSQVEEDNFKNAEKQEEGGTDEKPETNRTRRILEKPTLLKIAPDATTFEALTKAMCESVVAKVYHKMDPLQQKLIPSVYSHCSMTFALEELSDLFRQNTHDVSNFCIRAWDCGDYNYTTIGRGKTIIKRCCLNFIGGTTPIFMESVITSKIIADGFAARCNFIVEGQDRKEAFFIDPLSPAQKQARDEILAHIKKLTSLYGPVTLTQEAIDFCKEWSKEARAQRINTSIKLESWYGRQRVHLRKLAMSIHFGESTEMVMGVEPFKKALEVMRPEEKKMHLALGADDTNPLSKPSRHVLKLLRTEKREMKFDELYIKTFQYLPATGGHREMMEQVLVFLELDRKILKDRTTEGNRSYYVYKLIEQIDI